MLLKKKRKKIHLLKNSKSNFIQGVVATAMGFFSRGERLNSTESTTKTSESYKDLQGGIINGKLLRRNIKGLEDSG